MKWFEGSITEAVTTSKSRKAIFVVFIEGKDDASVQIAQAIDAAEVSSRLEKEQFVAIKLESGSENHRFFVQIYQLVPVPSLFFIGTNGTPLEIVAGSTTAADLVTKIDAVLTKAGKGPENSSASLIDAEKKDSGPSNNENSPQIPVTDPHTSSEKLTENAKQEDVSEISVNKISDDKVKNEPAAEAEKPGSSEDLNKEESSATSTKKTDEPELSVEEKVERARQLIELQRKQRQEEEERKEYEREVERRKMGRDVQKMRQKQQELEIKQAHEERMQEKAAEAAAREKVRQQIAQDKLERKQREQALQQQQQKTQQNVPEQAKPRAPLVADSTVTRIQFRLPSGNPHMGQFEPTCTLGTLRSYVVQNIDIPFPRFTMSTSFPRRELTNDDDNKTLLELELVPTAVILILPLKGSNVSTTVTPTQNVGFFSRFIWTFFAPIFDVYNFVVNYFTGGQGRNPNRRIRDANDESSASNAKNETIIRGVPQSSNLIRKNLASKSGTTVRAQGNIHRLHSSGDDNDENNTWNGNSTQQM